jgi:hypothetical protein
MQTCCAHFSFLIFPHPTPFFFAIAEIKKCFSAAFSVRLSVYVCTPHKIPSDLWRKAQFSAPK